MAFETLIQAHLAALDATRRRGLDRSRAIGGLGDTARQIRSDVDARREAAARQQLQRDLLDMRKSQFAQDLEKQKTFHEGNLGARHRGYDIAEGAEVGRNARAEAGRAHDVNLAGLRHGYGMERDAARETAVGERHETAQSAYLDRLLRTLAARSDEAASTRTFRAGEAEKGRAHQTERDTVYRDWRSGESALDRTATSERATQGIADRGAASQKVEFMRSAGAALKMQVDGLDADLKALRKEQAGLRAALRAEDTPPEIATRLQTELEAVEQALVSKSQERDQVIQGAGGGGSDLLQMLRSKGDAIGEELQRRGLTPR